MFRLFIVNLLFPWIGCTFQMPKPVADLPFTVDTLRISDTDRYEGSPFVWTLMHDVPGESFMAYYPNLRKIKFFDIGKNAPIREVSVAVYEDRYGIMQSVFYHNADSIFMLTENAIMLMRADGNVHKLAMINDSSASGVQGSYYIQDRYKNQMKYRNGKLYIPVVWFGKNREAKSTFGYFDVKTRKFGVLPVVYPSNYRREYYGFAEYSYNTILPEGLLFSFNCNDSVYLYRFSDESYMATAAKNPARIRDFIPVSRKYAKDSKKQMDTWMQTPYYSDVVYDPYRHLIYRVFADGVDLRKENGLFSTWEDKRTYLAVYRPDMSYIGNVEIPVTKFQYLLCVGEKGIYFIAGKEDTHYGDVARQTVYRMNITTSVK